VKYTLLDIYLEQTNSPTKVILVSFKRETQKNFLLHMCTVISSGNSDNICVTEELVSNFCKVSCSVYELASQIQCFKSSGSICKCG
jgi:hypothetical protein